MSRSEAPTPMPGDLQSLLDAERVGKPMPSDAQARVRSRVESTLGIVVVAAGAGVAAHTAGAAIAGSAAAKVGILTKPWFVAVTAFVLGGLTGAGVHAYVASKSNPPASTSTNTVIAAATPTSTNASSAWSASSGAIAQVAQLAPSTSAAPPLVATIVAPVAQGTSAAAAKPSTSEGKDTSLAAERSLIEVAHTALSRGDSSGAIAALDQHAKRFPFGQLGEEREALYVQALSQAGRRDEARVRALRFKKQFPGSLLLPVVEAATE